MICSAWNGYTWKLIYVDGNRLNIDYSDRRIYLVGRSFVDFSRRKSKIFRPERRRQKNRLAGHTQGIRFSIDHEKNARRHNKARRGERPGTQPKPTSTFLSNLTKWLPIDHKLSRNVLLLVDFESNWEIIYDLSGNEKVN